MNRRRFLQNAAGTAIVARTSPSKAIAAPLKSKMIGIQIGAVSFVDEGVERVLDECERAAAVNTLFVATFTYGRGFDIDDRNKGLGSSEHRSRFLGTTGNS